MGDSRRLVLVALLALALGSALTLAWVDRSSKPTHTTIDRSVTVEQHYAQRPSGVPGSDDPGHRYRRVTPGGLTPPPGNAGEDTPGPADSTLPAGVTDPSRIGYEDLPGPPVASSSWTREHQAIQRTGGTSQWRFIKPGRPWRPGDEIIIGSEAPPANFRLRDGTVVTLMPGSEMQVLRLAQSSSRRAIRLRLIRGRLLIDAASWEENPDDSVVEVVTALAHTWARSPEATSFAVVHWRAFAMTRAYGIDGTLMVSNEPTAKTPDKRRVPPGSIAQSQWIESIVAAGQRATVTGDGNIDVDEKGLSRDGVERLQAQR